MRSGNGSSARGSLFHLGLVMVVVASMQSFTSPASAITVDAYQKWRHSRQTVRATPTGIMEIRLHGVLQGLLIANADLRKRGTTPLFCVPKGAVLKATDLRKAVDAELKSPSTYRGKPYPAGQSIDAVVLVIARQKWPCRKTEKKSRHKEANEPGK